MNEITVYTKPACPQCDATKRHLDRQGTVYTAVDVSMDMEGLATVRELGYAAVPVVVAGNVHWTGFRPDLLNVLAVDAA